MTLRLKEEPIGLERTHGAHFSQTSAEGTVRLPAELPEFGEVVRWEGRVRRLRTQVAPEGGRVVLSGSLDLSAIYLSVGAESDSPAGALYAATFPEAVSFEHSIDAPEAEPSMRVAATAFVEGVEGRLRPDGRSADVDVVLAFEAQLSERVNQRLVTGVVTGPQDRISAAQDMARLQQLLGSASAPARSYGVLELPAGFPAVYRVLRVQAEPRVTSTNLSDGEASVQGEVDYLLLYLAQETREGGAAGQGGAGAGGSDTAGEGGPEPEGGTAEEAPSRRRAAAQVSELYSYRWRAGTSFEAAVPLEGAASKGATAAASVSLVRVDLRPSAMGRELVAEAEVEVSVEATAVRQVPLVTGIEAKGDETVETRLEPVQLETFVGEGRRSLSLDGVVEIPSGQPPVERIVAFGAAARLRSAEADEDKVNLAGSVDLWMLYVPYRDQAERPLAYAEWKAALQVDQAVPLAGVRSGMRCRARLSTGEVRPDLINRETVEVAVPVQVEVRVTDPVERELVAEAVSCPPPPDPAPSLCFVVTQAGDSLWKLSRRYRTSVEAIVQANPWLEESGLSGGEAGTQPLPKGAKLFIPRGPAQAAS